jgi:hypothetical protein
VIAVILITVIWLHRRGRPDLTGFRIRAIAADDSCPSCRRGVLRETNGRFGIFLGCSMFTVTGCRAAWSMTGRRINRQNYGKLR